MKLTKSYEEASQPTYQSESGDLYVRDPVGYRHQFYLQSEIEPGEFYSGLVHTLKGAGPSDSVHLHINSPGGCLATTLQVVQAIRECHAGVEASAEGDVMSGAALIFYAASSFNVSPLSRFLVHGPSMGTGGKLKDIKDHAGFSLESAENAYESILAPYYSEEEIKRVMDGQEMFEAAESVIARLDRVHDAVDEEVVMKIFVSDKSPECEEMIKIVKDNGLDGYLDVLDIKKHRKVAKQCEVSKVPALYTNSGRLLQGMYAVKQYLRGYFCFELKGG